MTMSSRKDLKRLRFGSTIIEFFDVLICTVDA